MTAPFDEGKHQRGAGGLFAASAAAGGHASGAWVAGPVRKGSRDARVNAAQKKLNALGMTDERGRPLLVDGINGNHTTAAIKKWQQSIGLPATGELDAKSMVALLTAQPKPRASTKMRSGTSSKRRSTSRSNKPAAKPGTHTATKAPAPYVDKGRGNSRAGGGVST